MKLMRERDQVRSVPSRWRAQYRNWPGEWQECADRLQALDPETASADDVAAITGNRAWAQPLECNECGTKTWDIVRVGEEPDHESNTAYMCADCLRAALRLLEEPTP